MSWGLEGRAAEWKCVVQTRRGQVRTVTCAENTLRVFVNKDLAKNTYSFKSRYDEEKEIWQYSAVVLLSIAKSQACFQTSQRVFETVQFSEV